MFDHRIGGGRRTVDCRQRHPHRGNMRCTAFVDSKIDACRNHVVRTYNEGYQSINSFEGCRATASAALTLSEVPGAMQLPTAANHTLAHAGTTSNTCKRVAHPQPPPSPGPGDGANSRQVDTTVCGPRAVAHRLNNKPVTMPDFGH